MRLPTKNPYANIGDQWPPSSLGMEQSQEAREFNQRNRPHPDEHADLRRTQPQPRPMNPWLFGALGIGAVAVAIALMAWGIPAATRFVVSLLAVDLSL